MYINVVVCQTSFVYSLLVRADKLETAAVQGSLACLAPPSVFFPTCVRDSLVKESMRMSVCAMNCSMYSTNAEC